MAAHSYQFDTSHSEVSFIVKHMMFAKVRGAFNEWSGEFVFDDADPNRNFVRAEIQSASIDTKNADRDAHLRSDDFFNSENYPTLVFESTSWTKTSSGYDVTGNLTIRAVTRPITLSVRTTGTGVDPWGNTRIGISATGVVNRKEYGLTWNQALEAGGVLVGDDVKVELELQAIRGEEVGESVA